MKRIQLSIALLMVMALAGCGGPSFDSRAATPDDGLRYPDARRADQVDDYHGTRVADPYRWMEQDSDEVRGWLTAQDRLLDAARGRGVVLVGHRLGCLGADGELGPQLVLEVERLVGAHLAHVEGDLAAGE